MRAAPILFQQGRQQAGLGVQGRGGREQHARRAGMQGQIRHAAAQRGQVVAAVVAGQGLQGGEAAPGGLQSGGRRRIQPVEFFGRRAPARRLQNQRRKIAFQYFRADGGTEPGGFLPGPEAQAQARLRASRASGPLIGGRQRDPFRDETGHIRGRIPAWTAAETRIHHNAYAFDGQGRFGNGGGQHNLAPTLRRRGNGRVLLGGFQIPVERMDIGIRRKAVLQFLGDAGYLRHAGQKYQNIALFRPQGATDDGGRVTPQGRRADGVRRRGKVAHVHGTGAPLAAQNRTVAEQGGRAFRVKRGGHDHKTQIRPQQGAAFETERKPEIRLQGALVKFVEQNAGHAGQGRVLLQQARENAFRDDLKARRGADGAFLTHAVPHKTADILAEQARGVAGKGARRHPARLQQENPVVVAPVGVQQPEGDAAAFSRARRGADHGAVAVGKRSEQGRAQRVYGRCREWKSLWHANSGGPVAAANPARGVA